MTINKSSWRYKIAFLFTPEDSSTAFEQPKSALLYPTFKPNGFGILKAILWMALSIVFAFLLSYHF